jgi:hypothetical protein
MQVKQLDHRSVEIPATFVASMAKFLRRCEAHEAERSQGRTSFPRVVTVELSEHARMWASYLDSLLEGFPDAPSTEHVEPGYRDSSLRPDDDGTTSHGTETVETSEHLSAKEPAAVGVEQRLAGPGGEEGARLLADGATERLSRKGFTPRQIRLWAEAYIASHGSGDVSGLIDWIGHQEARAAGHESPSRR